MTDQARPSPAPDVAERLKGLDALLRDEPGNVSARLERAAVLRALKRNEEAVADFEQILAIEPDRFDARANLANAQRDLGRYELALRGYDELLERRPDMPELHLNKAVALRRSGSLDAALACIEAAASRNDRLAHLQCERGHILRDLKRVDDALAAYGQAVTLDPSMAQAFNSRGNLHKQIGRVALALEDYNRALEAMPRFVEALNNRANLFRDMGHFAQALADYDSALSVDPGRVEVMINRGNVLRDLNRHQDAHDALAQAIRVKPDVPQAHLHLGKVLADVGKPVDAIASFDRAIDLKPDFWEVWFYKGSAYRELGRHREALDCFSRINKATADEVNFSALGNYLFSMNHADECSPQDYLEQARIYGRLARRLVTESFEHRSSGRKEGRIRVGLVSGDLQRHPVGYFLKNVLPHFCAERIELHAYSNCPVEDELTALLKPCFAKWNLVASRSDHQVAQQIHGDGIDILIDLSGHTNKSRVNVFAWKPAPVQASWLGYCASAGIEEIDYVIGDAVATPSQDEGHFCEKVWRLPESYFCFSPPQEDVPVTDLPALQNGFMTFGSFNKLSKMTDRVVEVWSGVLHAVPGSRLFLKSPILSDAETRRITLGRFEAHGIEPGRLILESAENYRAYLGAYGRVDVMLDPFPYPGATTTLEGMWMGVPFITMAGNRFLARNGETIAVHAGLQPCIARDPQDYIDKARAFAGELRGLALMRRRLRGRLLQTSLFDGKRFSAQLEQALHEMWQRHTESAQ